MKLNFVLLNILLLFPFLLNGQVDDTLKEFFKRNRNGEYFHNEIEQWLESNSLPKEKLLIYIQDGREADVSFLIGLVYQEAMQTISLKLKSENIYFMIKHGLSIDPSINESTVITYLSEFSPSLFSTQSKSMVASRVLQSNYNVSQLIRLSGQLNITDLVPHFESLLTDETSSISLKWSARLALAKMGDISQVKECIKRVKEIGINDQTVYSLMPDLIYIKNRLVFDYILEQILIDEKGCTSTNPDNEIQINCAFRLIEMIAPYIEDFPVKLYESGDIVTDDYSQTLLDVREWILSNNYRYKLKEE